MTPEGSMDAGDHSPQTAPQPSGDTARSGLRTMLLVIVAVVVLGWALRALAPVLVPLVTAILLVLAVTPVREWVEQRMPGRLRWLGIAAAMGLILLILAAFVGGLWIATQQVADKAPELGSQIAKLLEASGQGSDPQSGQSPAQPAGAIAGDRQDGAAGPSAGGMPQAISGSGQGGAGGGTALSSKDSTPRASGSGDYAAIDALRALGERALAAAGGIAATLLSSSLAVIAEIALVLFLTLLLLIESPDWRRKVRTITRPRTEWRLTESAEVIAGKLRRYLLLRTVVGLATAALYALWLWLFGVGLVLVWAMLTFLLNFIPTIGSLIAGLLPVAYALLTQDWGTALAVGAGLLVIEQVMGNYVDPRLQGRSIALSPLVILVALVFWTWAWGIAGALLAVPVTVALVVLGAHVPVLRPCALLLTDRTDMGGLDEATRNL